MSTYHMIRDLMTQTKYIMPPIGLAFVLGGYVTVNSERCTMWAVNARSTSTAASQRETAADRALESAT
jgi:hypothetical protein